MNDYYSIPYLEPYNLSANGMYIETPRQTPTDSYTGFIRGNLFEELYRPYIDIEPFTLTPQTEREALLNKVRECTFALIDLNLYLDVHPDDQEKIRLYNNCSKQKETLTQEYEMSYGPLTLDSEALDTYPWSWIVPPWPWEVR